MHQKQGCKLTMYGPWDSAAPPSSDTTKKPSREVDSELKVLSGVTGKAENYHTIESEGTRCNESIELSDLIGRRGTYQILASLGAFYNETIKGVSGVILQYMLVNLTMYWDWDADSGNRTSFSSASCKMDDVIRLNISSNISGPSARIVYESEYLRRSLTEKFGFVCEKSWMISLSKALPGIGGAIACLILGRLCDLFGRRRTSIAFQCMILVSCLCILFVQNLYMFVIALLVYGAAIMPSFIVYAIQVTEIIPPSWRVWYGNLMRYGVIVGEVICTAFAWIFKDWVYIEIAITVQALLSIIVAWYVLDSPSWLIVRGRDEDAKRNIKLILRRNGRIVEDLEQKIDLWITTMKENQKDDGAEKGNFSSLFMNRIIARRTIILSLALSFSLFAYSGFVSNVESFGSGLFKDILMINGSTVLGLIVGALLLVKISIKQLQILCLLIAAIDSVAYVFLFKYDLARSITGSAFRAVLAPAFCTSQVYISEVLPTSVRVVGTGFVGLCLLCSGILAQFAKDLGDKTQVYVPFILFAALTFASAVMFFFLPETKDMPLIQTVEELVQKEERESSD